MQEQSMLTIAAFGKPIPRPKDQAYPGLGEMTYKRSDPEKFPFRIYIRGCRMFSAFRANRAAAVYRGLHLVSRAS